VSLKRPAGTTPLGIEVAAVNSVAESERHGPNSSSLCELVAKAWRYASRRTSRCPQASIVCPYGARALVAALHAKGNAGNDAIDECREFVVRKL